MGYPSQNPLETLRVELYPLSFNILFDQIHDRMCNLGSLLLPTKITFIQLLRSSNRESVPLERSNKVDNMKNFPIHMAFFHVGSCYTWIPMIFLDQCHSSTCFFCTFPFRSCQLISLIVSNISSDIQSTYSFHYYGAHILTLNMAIFLVLRAHQIIVMVFIQELWLLPLYHQLTYTIHILFISLIFQT